jgi:alpha-ketoglutarate-dependent taurine dioxygenase
MSWGEEPEMPPLEVRELMPGFGAEISGFRPQMPLDPDTCQRLQALFDQRSVLVFRGLDIDHPYQLYLSTMLIRKEGLGDGSSSGAAAVDDNFYISNRRPRSAAPFGRLQFHSDTMWSDQPFEVLSLYGVEIEEPVIPTTFVSPVDAWDTLPIELRARVEGLSALHTAGEVRRGDLNDVLVSTVQRAPSTIAPIGKVHPRTGRTILYACEQMTKEVMGLEADESERLLGELFAHLYDPAKQWNHHWRKGDLVVWDNLAIQHARPNVRTEGSARTLRKVASPIPQLRPDELPTYTSAE